LVGGSQSLVTETKSCDEKSYGRFWYFVFFFLVVALRGHTWICRRLERLVSTRPNFGTRGNIPSCISDAYMQRPSYMTRCGRMAPWCTAFIAAHVTFQRMMEGFRLQRQFQGHLHLRDCMSNQMLRSDSKTDYFVLLISAPANAHA
jgi:hypothetical protein